MVGSGVSFMLSSQRALFDIPADVAYLNAAAWSPLPRATQEAARAAVSRKGQPWKLAPDFADTQHERARAAAAALIGADAERCRAGLLGRLRRRDRRKGARRSRAARACWCWRTITPRRCSNGSRRADAQGFTVETVAQPADGDWTSAVLEAIERPGAPPSVARVDLLDPLVGRRAARHAQDQRGVAARTAPRCWSMPRTASASSRPT